MTPQPEGITLILLATFGIGASCPASTIIQFPPPSRLVVAHVTVSLGLGSYHAQCSSAVPPSVGLPLARRGGRRPVQPGRRPLWIGVDLRFSPDKLPWNR